MSTLNREPIDPAAEIRLVERPEAGAIVTFSGVVRSSNRDRTVEAIDYHAYEDMALRQLDCIEDEIENRWQDVRARIVHRIGFLRVGETSVFIAVSAPHRPAAFAAARQAIERIKTDVPIWKKEIYPDGHAWIEGS